MAPVLSSYSKRQVLLQINLPREDSHLPLPAPYEESVVQNNKDLLLALVIVHGRNSSVSPEAPNGAMFSCCDGAEKHKIPSGFSTRAPLAMEMSYSTLHAKF